MNPFGALAALDVAQLTSLATRGVKALEQMADALVVIAEVADEIARKGRS